MALQISLSGLENLTLAKEARIGMTPVPARVLG